MNIPIVIFSSIGGTLSTTFIPMYCNIKRILGEEKSLKYTNNIFNIIIGICIILAIIGMIFTKQIVKVFAVGFEGETLKMSINFTRVLMLSIVSTGLSYIMTAYLQVKNNFTIPGLVSVPKNIVIIISIILSTKYGTYMMIWGTLLGLCTEFLFQLPFAIKSGYTYQAYINIKDEYIKKTFILIGPIFIGIAVNQINTMIDRSIASTLAEGSISSLNYANKLNGFVTAIFIASITSVIYPVLSKLSSENDNEKFIDTIVKSCNSIILLVVPISVGAIVLSTPIVRLLFQRGEFNMEATNMTSIALAMYSIGMIGFGLRDILSRVFYSLQDTKIPMINSVVAVIMNIVLNIVLSKVMGHAGLALATSVSSIICIVLLFNNLNKKVGYFGQDKIFKTILKSFISAVVMGTVVYFYYGVLNNIVGKGFVNELLCLFVSITVGFIVYGVIVSILKVEEINIFIDTVKKKIKKVDIKQV